MSPAGGVERDHKTFRRIEIGKRMEKPQSSNSVMISIFTKRVN